MTRQRCQPACTCGLHSERRAARISIGLQLHYEAVGVLDTPRAQQQREWARRNRTRRNARRRNTDG